MPLYDFECPKCAHRFEAFRRMNEGWEDLPCPACGAPGPRKLVSAFKTDAWSKFLDDMERKISPEKFR
ncbi:MAG TPA: zinc ribbon domain-containing protein [Syntrophales bacterium]|nr:zinc ribbon domain-containing protein [Syntrophales bacterium]HOM08045.1 zinc ribbon domain-containing protein [Syntrophales bacterium]HOO00672.1 zinc ribbon domain-containing protein [Syntrophales bacterium]HPC02049.1 zinc ribbon domain-containing protein [Syntrophales bacterium]HPQ07419.1 zinc ribbon domain-containing protein [Syntrophales bacterium]